MYSAAIATSGVLLWLPCPQAHGTLLHGGGMHANGFEVRYSYQISSVLVSMCKLICDSLSLSLSLSSPSGPLLSLSPASPICRDPIYAHAQVQHTVWANPVHSVMPMDYSTYPHPPPFTSPPATPMTPITPVTLHHAFPMPHQYEMTAPGTVYHK